MPDGTLPNLSFTLIPQIHAEKQAQYEAERLFSTYAKEWWQDFVQISLEHEHRNVQIFVKNEENQSVPVCSFVRPLRTRALNSPLECARFVSLLGYERTKTVGSGKSDQWMCLHTFLALGKGDVEDHANLLCSLFLGYNLNAFVCLGTDNKKQQHCWVMTIDAQQVVTFWESLTGLRYPVTPSSEGGDQTPPVHHFETIDCIYNNEKFFANIQPSNNVSCCDFNISNYRHWKGLSTEAIRAVNSVLHRESNENKKKLPSNDLIHENLNTSYSKTRESWINLRPALSLDQCSNMEKELTQFLFRELAHHRQEQGSKSTVWDTSLSYILRQALYSYELERMTVGEAVNIGNTLFQDAVKRSIGVDGQIFKAVPMHFNHTSRKRILSALIRSDIFRGLLFVRGSEIRFGLEVRIFAFPERVVACWVSFISFSSLCFDDF